MSNNLERKINSGYISKNRNGSFEVKYFETLGQRQKYLLENDELTKKYFEAPLKSKYVNSKRIADNFVGEE